MLLLLLLLLLLLYVYLQNGENNKRRRNGLMISETWPDDKGLCIELPKNCPMIPPTRKLIFRNDGISGPYNES